MLLLLLLCSGLGLLACAFVLALSRLSGGGVVVIAALAFRTGPPRCWRGGVRRRGVHCLPWLPWGGRRGEQLRQGLWERGLRAAGVLLLRALLLLLGLLPRLLPFLALLLPLSLLRLLLLLLLLLALLLLLLALLLLLLLLALLLCVVACGASSSHLRRRKLAAWRAARAVRGCQRQRANQQLELGGKRVHPCG